MKRQLFLCVIGCLIGNTWLCESAHAQLVEPEPTPVEKLEQKTELLGSAVTTLQKLKVSGYIQAQYQYAQTDADGNNFKLANRQNAYEQKELKDFGRFGIRRGRIKFAYEDGIASGVIQIDVTEKGINSDRNVVTFKDIYLNVKDPWMGTNAFKAGVFDRPFGHEIAYSSSRRESPERSRIIQSLFPDERDLGAMLTLQADKNSPWSLLKLEAGLFAGNGIKPQFDSHMDFIGHLSVSKTLGDNMSIGGGISAYLGSVFQNDSSMYAMKGNRFELESKSGNNIGKYATRRYIGFDLQYNWMTAAGLTQLRGEYIFGEHPGNSGGAYDFKFNVSGTGTMPSALTGPVYKRKLSGGYVILTQDLGISPLTFIAKYDWYDPNTQVSGNEVAAGDSGTGKGDLAMSTVGLGLMWRINPALRLTAYYDLVRNETTEHLKNTKDADGNITKYGYEGNRKDNVFTLRLQYKF